MYRVVKSSSLSGRYWDKETPNYYEEGTPRGLEVRDDYYSGKYSSGVNSDGSYFEQDSDVVRVLADLAGTNMFVQSYDDLTWYEVTWTKGVTPEGIPARVNVAKYQIKNGEYEFVEETLTSLSSLARYLDDPLVIRTLEEAVKESM